MLANLDLPESQAERLLQDLLQHRAEMVRALGRDPGVRVAALDFLSNVEQLLRNPKVVEMSEFEQTERSAITDPLTGLFNRRYFRTVMLREVRRSRRYSLTFSLLMLDLDAFKPVNDGFGHMFGDVVLQRVARLVRRAVRDSDVACRFGGDELSIIFPETDRLGAYTVAERIRRQVEVAFASRPVGEREVPMTVSGGIATFPDEGPDAAAMVGRADETLYAAKHAGRNRIVLYPGERRRSVRFPAKPTTQVGILRPQQQELLGASGINFSLDGALLETDAPYRRDDSVRLVLGGKGPLTPEGPCVVVGQVVRVESDPAPHRRVRIGVAFQRPIPEELLTRQVMMSSLSRAAIGAGT